MFDALRDGDVVVVPIEFVPYTNYIWRRTFGNLPLAAASYRQEVICRGETIRARRAIFLPGQVDRVKGTDPATTIEWELVTATSEILKPTPTIAHHVKDAVLVDGSIYRGRFKSFIAARSFFKSFTSRPEPKHLTTAGLASSHLGSRFFGHWLIDDCIQYRLAEQHGQPLCLRGPVRPDHQRKYASYLNQNWTAVDRAWIDHLIIYQDFHWGTAQDSLRGKQIEAMRDLVRANLPTGGHSSLVYLRRGATGASRRVSNEDEIVNSLKKIGFDVADIEAENLEQLLGKLANARIVISLEGSHVTHCAFSIPKNSGLIVLQPPDRFLSFHRGWTNSAGVWFGFVVGISTERGYHFSVTEILQTVDLMLKSVALAPAT